MDTWTGGRGQRGCIPQALVPLVACRPAGRLAVLRRRGPPRALGAVSKQRAQEARAPHTAATAPSRSGAVGQLSFRRGTSRCRSATCIVAFVQRESLPSSLACALLSQIKTHALSLSLSLALSLSLSPAPGAPMRVGDCMCPQRAVYGDGGEGTSSAAACAAAAPVEHHSPRPPPALMPSYWQALHRGLSSRGLSKAAGSRLVSSQVIGLATFKKPVAERAYLGTRARTANARTMCTCNCHSCRTPGAPAGPPTPPASDRVFKS